MKIPQNRKIKEERKFAIQTKTQTISDQNLLIFAILKTNIDQSQQIQTQTISIKFKLTHQEQIQKEDTRNS